MGVSFSAHYVRQTLIKVYQSSVIKQSTGGSTWDLVVPKFRYDLRPSGTLTEYRLHLSNKIHVYVCILSKDSLHSRINSLYY
jgi:hypothetical protein